MFKIIIILVVLIAIILFLLGRKLTNYTFYKAILRERKTKEDVFNVLKKRNAYDLSKYKHIIILCGHYEGVDERVLETIVTDYISIGDFVLTGGELPAMVMVDAIARMVPGVLSNVDSKETESFENNLLEYPQYSRPEEWNGKKVPAILLSGDHAKVDAWRHEQSLLRTKQRRPDLLENAELSKKDQDFLNKI